MASYNITNALLSGLTFPATSEIDSISRTLRVEIAELMAQDTGAFILADPVHAAKQQLQVSGDGPHGMTLVEEQIADPSTMTAVRLETGEKPNGRVTFSVQASADVAFVDPNTSVGAVGSEPAIGHLIIKSVEYSAVESVRRTAEVKDLVLIGSDGTPIDRATLSGKSTFQIVGRGDAPVGVAAGTGGAAFVGASTGIVVVGTFGENEKRGDWNGWNTDGGHYKAAS